MDPRVPFQPVPTAGGWCSGGFSAHIRRRTDIHYHIRTSTIVRAAAAATIFAVAAASTASAFHAAFTTAAVPASVSAAVVVTISAPGAAAIARSRRHRPACSDIWSDSIYDGAVINHARASALVDAIVTTIPAVDDAAGASCAGVQPDQVQDGPGHPHAGRVISLAGLPVFGPPGSSNVEDGRHGAGIDVEYG